MTEFNSTSKFRVTLVHSDGDTERVNVQIGLDGLKILDGNSNRALRSYELGHISRWQSRGSSLILYTKTPVDLEERQLTLQGDDYTIRSALDVLTCSCMQLAELLQSKQSSDAQETANSLHALVAGDGKKQSTKLPSADDVQYWTAPAMEGWLQSQGEHIKSWRKRWFVLKQGYLFRFMNASVSESTKPRGVVDLSKVQDVSQATKTTGKPFSFQLKTASGGSVCYLCENETDLVMWMSAINREIEKIVKKLAGVEDEPPKQSASSKSSGKTSSKAPGGSSAVPSEWMKQLERGFDNLSTDNTKGSGRNNQYNASAMVDVVGYESLGGGGGGGGGGGSSSAYANNHGSGLDYGSIAGANTVGSGSGGLSADILLNYGGGGGGGDRTAHSTSSNYGASNRPSSYTTAPSYGSAANATGYQTGSAGSYGHAASGGAYGAAGSGGYGGSNGYGAGAAYSTPTPTAQHSGYGQPAQYSQPLQQQTSLIDQVPQSQPAYPYYQQGMPQASAGSQPSQWQVHHTAEGRPYYYNAATGTTQWEPPASM